MGQQANPNHSVTNPDHVLPDDSQTTPTQARVRKRRFLLALGVLLITIVGLILWVSSVWRQRTFNGKPESYWINSLSKARNFSSLDFDEWQADRKEWRTLGPQAVPILITALEMRPGLATKPYARYRSRLPTTLQKMLPPPMDYERLHYVAWAKLADQTNRVSIPAKLVTRALKDQVLGVRYNALACLNLVILPNSGAEKDQFLPWLLDAAYDPQMEVRMSAVDCLGHYRDQPNVVIPVLSNALENPYPDVRIRAAMALNRVDPAAAERARVKDVAYDRLKSSTQYWMELATQFQKELEMR